MKGEYELSEKSTVIEGSRPGHDNVFTVVGWKVTRTAYPDKMGDVSSELFLESANEVNKKEWITLLNKAIKGETFNMEILEEEVASTCNPFDCCFG